MTTWIRWVDNEGRMQRLILDEFPKIEDYMSSDFPMYSLRAMLARARYNLDVFRLLQEKGEPALYSWIESLRKNPVPGWGGGRSILKDVTSMPLPHRHYVVFHGSCYVFHMSGVMNWVRPGFAFVFSVQDVYQAAELEDVALGQKIFSEVYTPFEIDEYKSGRVVYPIEPDVWPYWASAYDNGCRPWPYTPPAP